MKIGILPYPLRRVRNLSKTDLSMLVWPGQETPQGRVIADLTAQDHVVVYPSSMRLYRGFGPLSCKVSLILVEPKAVHGHYYRWVWLLRHKFNNILCRNVDLVNRYPNVLRLTAVESWVQSDCLHNPPPKDRQCSLIASDLNKLEGHKLRHQIVRWIRMESLDVAILGYGYQPLEKKQDGLLPYRYSVIIENSQEPDYFTEKLLDCILCGTFPIYWGAPNIGDYFDIRGMLICQSAQEIKQALKKMDRPFSDIQTDAMHYNQKQARLLSRLHEHIVTVLQDQETER